MKSLCGVAFLLLLQVGGLAGQRPIDRSPNIQGVWGLDTGSALFIFAHRFEFLDGVDELASIPTFTLAAGVPLGLTAGVDFTTYSEAIPDRLTGNEAQFWLKRGADFGVVDAAILGGYNTAASSFDGALDLRGLIGSRGAVYLEGRAFSDLFGLGEAGAAGTIGGSVRLTEYLAVAADWGGVLTEDDVPTTWSAALNIEVPATPHFLSLLITDAGATTLQGTSREKVIGTSSIRYGFTFQVPVGGPRWARIFDPLTGGD